MCPLVMILISLIFLQQAGVFWLPGSCVSGSTGMEGIPFLLLHPAASMQWCECRCSFRLHHCQGWQRLQHSRSLWPLARVRLAPRGGTSNHKEPYWCYRNCCRPDNFSLSLTKEKSIIFVYITGFSRIWWSTWRLWSQRKQGIALLPFARSNKPDVILLSFLFCHHVVAIVSVVIVGLLMWFINLKSQRFLKCHVSVFWSLGVCVSWAYLSILKEILYSNVLGCDTSTSVDRGSLARWVLQGQIPIFLPASQGKVHLLCFDCLS